MNTLTTSFDGLKDIKSNDVFHLRGYQYIAIENAITSTRDDHETVFIRANRRNSEMPSGWECADVRETRQVKIEPETDTDSEMAAMILQEAINALDPSALEQIAAHLESHRDMADRATKHSSFRVRANLLQSNNMDLVKMLAAHCRAALNAQTGKTAVKG
jgi:ABC-type dipeptide/oligopeptide/nickel transport system ATPase component